MSITNDVMNSSTGDTLTTTLPITSLRTNENEPTVPGCTSVETIRIVVLAISTCVTTATVILIPCHRRLRKQHYILPYNLVLADFSGAIASVVLFAQNYRLDLGLTIILWTSFAISLLTISLISGYQFITIRVDPFGTRNIITTPRLIAVCLLAWVISLIISASTIIIFYEQFLVYVLSMSFITTFVSGICYIFIYRSIAKIPCDGNITRERKQGNQKVLRTFGLIFGTTVICWICPWVYWTMGIFTFPNVCLKKTSFVMMNVNWIANSFIYWWRLEEFRSMFMGCKRPRRSVDIVDT